MYPFRKFFENLYINVLWFISPSFIHKIPIHPFHPRPTLKNVNSVRQTSSLQHSFTVSLKTDFLENAWCTYGELPPPPPRKNCCSNSSAGGLHSSRKRFFFVRRWLAPSSFLLAALFPPSIVLTRDGRSSSRANPAGFLGYERCSPARILEFRKSPRRCGRRRLCIRKKSLETAARFRPSSLCLSIHLLNSPRFPEWLAIFSFFIVICLIRCRILYFLRKNKLLEWDNIWNFQNSRILISNENLYRLLRETIFLSTRNFFEKINYSKKLNFEYFVILKQSNMNTLMKIKFLFFYSNYSRQSKIVYVTFIFFII